MKRITPILALAFVLGAFFLVQGKAFTLFWHRWLIVSVPMERADALIVLGGEHQARPQMAADLFRSGIAPMVYVTGIGDAGKCRQVLMESGVPSERIIMETKATSTYTNAELLKPILEANHVHTALLVTSPFHTRRALATFQKVIPEISFGVTDASISWWKTPEGRGDVNRFAAIEFIKTAEYWLIYGVSPFSIERK